MTKLMIPTVNLNGTSKQSLMQELSDAIYAIDKALDAMRNVTVHGRDFPDTGKLREALKQESARFRKVHEVRDELEQIAIMVDEQGN